jgi:glutathionylspermidine synthase
MNAPKYPILCTWMVGGKCEGVIVRECEAAITTAGDVVVPVVLTDDT